MVIDLRAVISPSQTVSDTDPVAALERERATLVAERAALTEKLRDTEISLYRMRTAYEKALEQLVLLRRRVFAPGPERREDDGAQLAFEALFKHVQATPRPHGLDAIAATTGSRPRRSREVTPTSGRLPCMRITPRFSKAEPPRVGDRAEGIQLDDGGAIPSASHSQRPRASSPATPGRILHRPKPCAARNSALAHGAHPSATSGTSSSPR